MKTVLGCIRRADEHFRMIEPGDRVGIGVSGGKDSLLLLNALALYRYVRHHDFTIHALMLTSGPEEPDTGAIERMCAELDVPVTIRYTRFYQILFEKRNDRHPCALCAKMRRAALCDLCTELGLNKLALGHHREDALETLMMSLLFEGRLHTFHPCSYMSRSDLTVIRPMVYISEKHIIHMQRELNLPVLKNPCPANGNTRRQEMKELLNELCRRYPNAKEMMLSALQNEAQYGLWEREEGRLRKE